MVIAQKYNATAMVAFVEQIQQYIASHLANVQQYNMCGNRSKHWSTYGNSSTTQDNINHNSSTYVVIVPEYSTRQSRQSTYVGQV